MRDERLQQGQARLAFLNLEAVTLLQRYRKILANPSPPSQPQRLLPKTPASPNSNSWVAPAHASEGKAKPAQHHRTRTKAKSHLIAIKQILNEL